MREQTFKLKILSSKKLRELCMKIIPPFCLKCNCKCIDIKNEKKWYWINDIYTIIIEGEEKNLKYIELQFNLLTHI